MRDVKPRRDVWLAIEEAQAVLAILANSVAPVPGEKTLIAKARAALDRAQNHHRDGIAERDAKIERLQAEVEEWKATAEDWRLIVSEWKAKADRRADEIAMLRADRDVWRKAYHAALEGELDDMGETGLRAEIERLREYATKTRVALEETADEIERLKANMREIASQCHNLPRCATADRIAALAGKEE